METQFVESQSYRPYDGRDSDPLAVMETDLDRFERIVGEFADEDVWKRPAPGMLSLGNLALHVCGSLHDWLGNGVLGRSSARDARDEKERDHAAPEELMALFQEARSLLRAVRESAPDLGRIVHFRGKDRAVGYLILQEVEHVAYHLGQAAFLRRWVANLKPNFP